MTTQPEREPVEPLAPLWTNKMIYEWSDAAKESVLHKNRIRDMISTALAEGLAETMRDEYETDRARLAQQLAERDATIAELTRTIAELRQELEAQAGWEDAEYNDIINVDNNNQLRVVINHDDPDARVHLHIRKRVNGEWRHAVLTTLLSNFRLQRRKAGGDE